MKHEGLFAPWRLRVFALNSASARRKRKGAMGQASIDRLSQTRSIPYQ